MDNRAMSESADLILARIDQRLSEIGHSRYWLSKEITEGKSTSVFTDMARRKYIPKEPRMTRIAERLEVSVDWLMGRVDNPNPVFSEVSLREERIDWRGPKPGVPGIPLVGTGDCADLVLQTEDGDELLVERSSFEADHVVRMIARPPALQGAKDLYAIYFHGESMSPRFEPGEVGIVDPQRPCRPGDDVVVQLRETDEDVVTSVIVKRYIRRARGQLVLQQFNPAIEFAIPDRQIKAVHRIVPQTELLI